MDAESDSVKPHVLFLSYHLPMPDEPGAFRPWMEARLLVRAGFDVTVVTSGVQYMTGEDIRPNSGWCTKEVIGDIRILRTWAPTHHRNSLSKRILNYLSYTLLAGAASIFRVGEVHRLFSCTDPIFIMPMVFLVSLIKKAPFVLDERDLYPETAIALGVLKEGLLASLVFKMQHFFRRKALGIVAATPGIRSILISYGCPEEKIQLLYNADSFLDENRGNDIEKSFKKEVRKNFLIGYVGGLGRANDVSTLLRAARNLRHMDDLAFVIIGSGEMRSRYKEFCRKESLENVFIYDAVPRCEARNLMRQLDVCIQPLPPHLHFSHTLTSKTFDYHGLGKPMIFCGRGDTVKLLESSGGGVAVGPGDDKALADAIRQLHEDDGLRLQMGISARKWFVENIEVNAACAIIRKAMGVDGEL